MPTDKAYDMGYADGARDGYREGMKDATKLIEDNVKMMFVMLKESNANSTDPRP